MEFVRTVFPKVKEKDIIDKKEWGDWLEVRTWGGEEVGVVF